MLSEASDFETFVTPWSCQEDPAAIVGLQGWAQVAHRVKFPRTVCLHRGCPAGWMAAFRVPGTKWFCQSPAWLIFGPLLGQPAWCRPILRACPLSLAGAAGHTARSQGSASWRDCKPVQPALVGFRQGYLWLPCPPSKPTPQNPAQRNEAVHSQTVHSIVIHNNQAADI